MPQKKQEIIPFGMDMDTDPHFVGIIPESFQGAVREVINMSMGKTGTKKSGVYQNINSNVKIDHPLPPGRKKTIGAYEDKTTNSGFVFIWNEQGNHTIIQVFPGRSSAGETVIQTVAQGPEWNFDEHHLITGISVVQGAILKFTDYYNQARSVNIPRSNNTDKINVLRLYFPQWVEAIDSRSFSIQVLNSGNPVLTLNNFYSSTDGEVQDFNAMIRGWCAAFSLTLAVSFLTAQSRGTFAELTATNTNDITLVATFVDTIATVAQPAVTMKCPYYNRYNV